MTDLVSQEVVATDMLEVWSEKVLVSTQRVVELLEVAKQGIPGPQGVPGSAGAAYLTYPAGETISGHRVIKIEGGSAMYASSDVPTDANRMQGLSLNAALVGDPVNIQYSGEVIEPSWNWVTDQVVFCGAGGVLTQTPPVGVQVIIGIASAPTKIVVNIRQPIITS